ncbi:MAG TPA: hypothetical protein VD861_21095 [Pyrinomonadaceae bacterium]|nr:hypothetical protein [Pyrinomonadaceae bacterium]
MDYVTVVAPDFICESGAAYDLARLAGGRQTPGGQAYYLEVHESKMGEMTLVFQVVEATAEDIGESDHKKLRDEHGRPIYLIEGIVIPSLLPDVRVTKDDLDKVHALMAESFKEFWGRERWSPRASSSLSLESGRDASDYLTLLHQPPVRSKPSQRPAPDRAPVKGPAWEMSFLDSGLDEGGEAVATLAFSPDGRKLVSKRNRRAPILWDTRTRSVSNVVNREYFTSDSYHPLCFNPSDASQLIIGFNDRRLERQDRHRVLLWDTKERTLGYLSEIRIRAAIRFLTLTSSGKTIVTIDEDNVALDLTLGPLSCLLACLFSEGSFDYKMHVHLNYRVEAMSISPDKSLRITGDDRGVVRLYEDNFEAKIFEVRAHSSQVTAVTFTPDSRYFITAGRDREIAVWDSKNFREVQRLYGHGQPIKAILLSSRGDVMVSADVGGTIKVWDTMPWADRETLRVQGTSLSAVGLSPDGRVIATATDKNRIQLWSRRSP